LRNPEVRQQQQQQQWHHCWQLLCVARLWQQCPLKKHCSQQGVQGQAAWAGVKQAALANVDDVYMLQLPMLLLSH
jgi:hypothetical protein